MKLRGGKIVVKTVTSAYPDPVKTWDQLRVPKSLNTGLSRCRDLGGGDHNKNSLDIQLQKRTTFAGIQFFLSSNQKLAMTLLSTT